MAGSTWRGESIESVWLLDPKSGARREVSVQVPCWSPIGVCWSPDGEYLACELGDHEGGRALLVTCPDRGESFMPASDNRISAHLYGWLGDTGRLLFSMGLFPGGSRHLWVCDWATEQAYLLTDAELGKVCNPTPAEDGVVFLVRLDESTRRYRLVGLRPVIR